MNRCQHCDRACANRSSLKRHISAKHPSEAVDHGHTPMRYQCPHCHADFQRRETVRRHVRIKHDRDLSACSFCSKGFRADYMPQHRATCARRYWRKVQRHASSTDVADTAQIQGQLLSSRASPPGEIEVGNHHFRDEDLPEARVNIDTLRIVHENMFDARLAAVTLTQALLWFEENEDIESYKAALVTALCLNINFSAMRRSHTRPDSFDRLYWLALNVSELVLGFRQINDPDYHTGETILHKACDAGVSEILEPLFWKGACFDAINKHGWTPLDRAIRSGDINTIRYALALGSDSNRNCPLLVACCDGRHDIMTILVEYGADINQPLSEEGNATLLSVAVDTNDPDLVQLALLFGADPNIAHPIGDLISECLDQGCLDCVHEETACLLVEKGADVSRQHDDGHTVFHYAAIKAHVKLLRAALDRISTPAVLDIEDIDQDTALHCAVETSGEVPSHRTLTSISMLLEAGADVNVQDRWGNSALISAARKGNEELVRLLLEGGASVKTRNFRKQTALSCAAYRGHGTIVGILLEKAPSTHDDSSYLALALEEAVAGSHENVVNQLISFGADSSAGASLSLALLRSSSEVVQILLDAGARFDALVPVLVAAVFGASIEVAEGRPSYYIEAPAKCELLLLAFPKLRELYAHPGR